MRTMTARTPQWQRRRNQKIRKERGRHDPIAVSLPTSLPLVIIALPTFPPQKTSLPFPLHLCWSYNLYQQTYREWWKWWFGTWASKTLSASTCFLPGSSQHPKLVCWPCSHGAEICCPAWGRPGLAIPPSFWQQEWVQLRPEENPRGAQSKSLPCRIMSCVNDSCFKPLSFRSVCYAAKASVWKWLWKGRTENSRAEWHEPQRNLFNKGADYNLLAKLLQLGPTFCNPMDCSWPGSSVRGIWSGLPCSPPLGLPDPGTEPTCPVSPALAGRFLTTSTRLLQSVSKIQRGTAWYLRAFILPLVWDIRGSVQKIKTNVFPRFGELQIHVQLHNHSLKS